MTQDEQKQAVAREAIKYVVDDALIGVGSGSTANLFIDELAKIRHRIKGAVASSVKTSERLKSHGIYVEELNNVDDIPVYIDGADEVTRARRDDQGRRRRADAREDRRGGGAQVRLHRRRHRSLSTCSGRFPLPVEVIPMARSYVARELVQTGRAASLAHRLHHRQRQRHPRRARFVDRESGRDRGPTCAQSSASSRSDFLRRRGADVILMGTDGGVRTLTPVVAG